MRGLLRTYFPPLPRSVLTLQVGGLVNAFGAGLALSPNGVWIAAAALCAIGAACTLVVEGTLPTRARRTPMPATASA